jgi:hypothetical protein
MIQGDIRLVEAYVHIEIIHVKEKREQRYPQVGFIQVKPQERVASYEVFCTGFPYMYVGASGGRNVYTWELKDMPIHLENHVYMGHITDHPFLSLSVFVFLTLGHHPCYGSPDFSTIKSFSTLVFPLWFF